MRIWVRLSDRTLTRAVGDLLRAHGHEVVPFQATSPPPALRIVSDTTGNPAPEDCATLLLQRGARAGTDPDPGAALREALDRGGTATWGPPLDPHLLVTVLADEPVAPAPLPACAAPDLTSAPHAWLVVNLQRGRVVAANPDAHALLDLPADAKGTPLENTPLPGALREALAENSDGLFPAPHLDGGRVCVWWTDQYGRRVLCLLQSPVDRQTQEARNQRALAEMGRMAATLAHEIRNPVASVAGALDLLEGEGDPTDRAEILAMARQRLAQMSNLLEQTLHLARPIEGEPGRVEVQPVIRSVAASMGVHVSCENARIEVEVPDEIVEVTAFEDSLLQALTNLVQNAGQCQDGGGRIRISLTSDTRRAHIRVHDDGPGIPPEKREEVFRPFYTTKANGTGLGLAEVRRAMEAAGGAVVVEDVPSGACLRLDLPLAATQ